MNEKETQLKLFVWTNVLTDYSSGMMVALAADVEEARRLLEKEAGFPDDLDFIVDLASEPLVVTDPAAFYVYGGG